jgi:hypothetical protein
MRLDDMIGIPSFMKISAGVQAILRFCLWNLRDGRIYYAVEKELRSMIYITSFI